MESNKNSVTTHDLAKSYCRMVFGSARKLEEMENKPEIKIEGLVLEVGKRYRLYSGDVIKVIAEAMSPAFDVVTKDPEIVCKCELVVLDCSSYSEATRIVLYSRLFIHYNWPGQKLGDKMTYLKDGGFYCGWDGKAMPFHVKEKCACLEKKGEKP